MTDKSSKTDAEKALDAQTSGVTGKPAETPATPNGEQKADLGVANPSTGDTLPATQAQADATTAQTLERGTIGGDAAAGEPLTQAHTLGSEPTDPLITGVKLGEEKPTGKTYTAKESFVHGFDKDNTISGTKGERVNVTDKDQIKTLTDLGYIEESK